jgi:hypothetical protein
MSMELSPEQRHRLARLIESELAALRDAAVTAGTAPSTVADIFEERQRLLEAATADDRHIQDRAGDATDDDTSRS